MYLVPRTPAIKPKETSPEKLIVPEKKRENKKASLKDFPGGAVVDSPPANAGGPGFEPWSGRIPHAVEQLSPCATTTEPAF